MSIEHSHDLRLYPSEYPGFEQFDPPALFGDPRVERMRVHTNALAIDVETQLQAAKAWADAKELQPLQTELDAAKEELAHLEKESIQLSAYHDAKEAIQLLNEVQKINTNPHEDLSEYDLDPQALAELGFSGREIDNAKQDLMETMTDPKNDPEILRGMILQLKNPFLRRRFKELIDARDEQAREDMQTKENRGEEQGVIKEIGRGLMSGAKAILAIKDRLPEKETAALYHVWLKRADQELKRAFSGFELDPTDIIDALTHVPEEFFPLAIVKQRLVDALKEATRERNDRLSPQATNEEVESAFFQDLGSSFRDEKKTFLQKAFREGQETQNTQQREAAIEERLVSEAKDRATYDQLTAQIMSTEPGIDVTALFDPLRADPSQIRIALRKVLESPRGPAYLKQFPELFERFSPVQRAEFFLKTNPAAALEISHTFAGKSSEAIGGLDGVDERFAIIENICIHAPNAIPLLREENLSETEKKALVLRVYKTNIGSALKVSETLEVTFSSDEQEMLMNQAVDDLKESDREMRALTDPTRIEEKLEKGRAETQNLAHLFGWNQREVATFFERYTGEELELLQRLGFRIPTKLRGVPLNEAQEVVRTRPENPGQRERERILVGHANRLEEALSGALIAQDPSQEEMFRAQREREQALRGEIEFVGAIGGQSATAPLFVMIKGETFPAVYKSALREPPFAKNPKTGETLDRPYRLGVPVGEAIYREWLVAQISKAFQLGVVPATVLCEGPEGLGTIQEWQIGQDGGDLPDVRGMFPEIELMKLALLDCLVKHSDRHGGNFFLTADKKAVAIDNGFAFSSAFPEQKDEGLMSYPAELVKGKLIPEALQQKIRQARANTPLMEALKDMFSLAFYKEGEALWEAFQARLEEFAPSKPGKRAVFPQSDWWPYGARP